MTSQAKTVMPFAQLRSAILAAKPKNWDGLSHIAAEICHRSVAAATYHGRRLETLDHLHKGESDGLRAETITHLTRKFAHLMETDQEKIYLSMAVMLGAEAAGVAKELISDIGEAEINHACDYGRCIILLSPSLQQLDTAITLPQRPQATLATLPLMPDELKLFAHRKVVQDLELMRLASLAIPPCEAAIAVLKANLFRYNPLTEATYDALRSYMSLPLAIIGPSGNNPEGPQPG